MVFLMKHCSQVLGTSVLEIITHKIPKRINIVLLFICLQRAALEEAGVGSVLIRVSFDKTGFGCLFFF